MSVLTRNPEGFQVFYWDVPGQCNCGGCPKGWINVAYVVDLRDDASAAAITELRTRFGAPSRVEPSSQNWGNPPWPAP
jgi:hypothetical protein